MLAILCFLFIAQGYGVGPEIVQGNSESIQKNILTRLIFWNEGPNPGGVLADRDPAGGERR